MYFVALYGTGQLDRHLFYFLRLLKIFFSLFSLISGIFIPRLNAAAVIILTHGLTQVERILESA